MEESIVFPSSHCTNCKHKLDSFDLIPVLSYVFLKGRCKYCNERISLRYPLIEILNALLYLIVYLKFGMVLTTLKYCILISMLIVIAMIDYDTQYVFTNTTILGVIVGIVFLLIQGFYYKTGAIDLILGAIIGFLAIGLIVFITKGMGTGDIEISAMCGIFLGTKGILLGLFLSIVIGGIIGIIILCFKLKKVKEKIAFVPFIAVGCFVSMIWNTEILNYYLNLFR